MYEHASINTWRELGRSNLVWLAPKRSPRTRWPNSAAAFKRLGRRHTPTPFGGMTQSFAGEKRTCRPLPYTSMCGVPLRRGALAAPLRLDSTAGGTRACRDLATKPTTTQPKAGRPPTCLSFSSRAALQVTQLFRSFDFSGAVALSSVQDFASFEGFSSLEQNVSMFTNFSMHCELCNVWELFKSFERFKSSELSKRCHVSATWDL